MKNIKVLLFFLFIFLTLFGLTTIFFDKIISLRNFEESFYFLKDVGLSLVPLKNFLAFFKMQNIIPIDNMKDIIYIGDLDLPVSIVVVTILNAINLGIIYILLYIIINKLSSKFSFLPIILVILFFFLQFLNFDTSSTTSFLFYIFITCLTLVLTILCVKVVKIICYFILKSKKKLSNKN